MPEPLFTVAIPTFNRAERLKETVARVLQQDYDDFEVLISDNASDDSTFEVAQGICDKSERVRYVRQQRNMGSSRNFRWLVDNARGRWLIFHQDDDMLSKFFLSRCASAIMNFPDASLYIATTARSDSSSVFSQPTIFTQPFPLDWMGSAAPQQIPSTLLLPFALFSSVAIPPGEAFRTDAIRETTLAWNDECYLLNERLMLAEVALRGTVVAEPWIAAVYCDHEEQLSAKSMHLLSAHWSNMVTRLEQMIAERNVSWEPDFENLLQVLPRRILKGWLNTAEGWVNGSTFCDQVTKMLKGAVTNGENGEQLTRPGFSRKINRLTQLLRPFVPPIALEAAARCLKGKKH